MLFGRVGQGPNPTDYPGDLSAARHLQLLDHWPKSTETAAPANTPEKVASAYLDGVDSLNRKRWSSAGMMFRRALELATLQADRSFAGKPLAARIDALAKANLVTPAMKEWAHIVRLEGNVAVHEEEEIDEATAKALQSFTETFLMYAFTLPAMVAERKPGEKPE
jgi:hypothetical protein